MKIDFHTHSFYSNDGISSPEDLIKSALKKGLDGIALTDHNTTDGWKDAKKAAKKLNAVLILGEEIKIKEKGRTTGEILGYFLKNEINPKGKTKEDVIEEIKKQGGLAIIAHPYHWRKPFLELEKYKCFADGVEAFNSRSQSKKGNRKSMEFAKKSNLAMTAGSDAHSKFEIGRAYVKAEANSIEEFKKLIISGKSKIVGKQSFFFLVQPFAALGKILHLFWEPKK